MRLGSLTVSTGVSRYRVSRNRVTDRVPHTCFRRTGRKTISARTCMLRQIPIHSKLWITCDLYERSFDFHRRDPHLPCDEASIPLMGSPRWRDLGAISRRPFMNHGLLTVSAHSAPMMLALARTGSAAAEGARREQRPRTRR